MGLIRIKCLVSPYIEISVGGESFRMFLVTLPGPDQADGKKAKSYFIGLNVSRQLLAPQAPVRLSVEEWSSTAEAYHAWWQGFSVDPDASEFVSSVVSQLIDDRSVVAVSVQSGARVAVA